DEEQLTGFGQLHRRTRTVHQGQPQGVFQAADAPAERRLGDKAALGRLGKAAGRGQGDEIFQPFGFDVHSSSSDSARPPSSVTATLCRSCMAQQLTALAGPTAKGLW